MWREMFYSLQSPGVLSWSYPEPFSFSDRVSVLFSDALLTLSLDWLAFSPASAPAAGGSFLFFLAKNFLNVWNFDFFFPVKNKRRKWKLRKQVEPSSAASLQPTAQLCINDKITDAASLRAALVWLLLEELAVKVQVGAPGQTKTLDRWVFTHRRTGRHHTLRARTACKPSPPGKAAPLALQWKNSTSLLRLLKQLQTAFTPLSQRGAHPEPDMAAAACSAPLFTQPLWSDESDEAEAEASSDHDSQT